MGCAHPTERNDWSTYEGEGKAYFTAEEVDFPVVPDPLEPLNRSVDGLSYGLLVYVVDPVTAAWRFGVPEPARDALWKAAVNLGYPARLVNDIPQWKWRAAGTETARFLTNTTVGIVGHFDPA